MENGWTELLKQRDELLEAIELLYDHCRLYHPEVEKNNVGERVRAVIAKAKQPIKVPA